MADELEQFRAYVGGLAASLEPGERIKLARAVARDMRVAQVERIAAQRNPDGSAFAPRKRQPLRSKSGRIKRRAQAMFAKLRRREYLREQATAAEASVGFPNAQVSRIAYVHQLGLRDKVRRTPDSPEVEYPARVLLGFSEDDERRTLDLVLAHLKG